MSSVDLRKDLPTSMQSHRTFGDDDAIIQGLMRGLLAGINARRNGPGKEPFTRRTEKKKVFSPSSRTLVSFEGRPSRMHIRRQRIGS